MGKPLYYQRPSPETLNRRYRLTIHIQLKHVGRSALLSDKNQRASAGQVQEHQCGVGLYDQM
jgi:hypothetical protein